EVAGSARCERAEQGTQLRERPIVALAPLDRGAPRRLDEIEQRFAPLLAHELADELAEPVHVLAQGLILFRKDDVGACDVFRWRSGHATPPCSARASRQAGTADAVDRF